MSEPQQISIEGYSVDEILALDDETVRALVFSGSPAVFRIGSAEILGEFRMTDDRLVIELAHIDGGGEGVLPTLWASVSRYAQQRSINQIEWIVHAANRAVPNLKLSAALERKGFERTHMVGIGETYRLIHHIRAAART